MNNLMESGRYSKNAAETRSEIDDMVKKLFDSSSEKLSSESIFSLLIDACVSEFASRKLLQDDPFSDDDELASDFAVKVLDKVEPLILTSDLPKEKIVAYVTRLVNNLASDPVRKAGREAH